MSEKIVLPHILTQSVKLSALVEGCEIGTGSGFTCSDRGQTWLVSNRHVLLGRYPENNNLTDPQKRQPTQVKITWVRDDLKSESLVIDLFGADCLPLWIEHPPLAHELDLVAIKVPSGIFVDVDLTTAIKEDAEHTVTVGDPVAVIGFPFGLSAGVNGLPIMFSGIVASPPGIDIDEKPRFLIDSRTRPGLSGSPVYYYPNATAVRRGASGETFFPSPVFLGLYCGRTNDQSDLGYVINSIEVARTVVHENPGVIFI